MQAMKLSLLTVILLGALAAPVYAIRPSEQILIAYFSTALLSFSFLPYAPENAYRLPHVECEMELLSENTTVITAGGLFIMIAVIILMLGNYFSRRVSGLLSILLTVTVASIM